MSAARANSIDLREAAEALERTLEALTERYAELEELGAVRIEALRRADGRSVSAAIQRENEVVQRVAALNQERAQSAGLVAKAVGASGDAPRVGELAERLPGAAGRSLATAGDRLKEAIGRVQAQNARAKAAATALAAHMQGLIQQAERALSHSGAYGRTGVVAAGPSVVTALDATG